MGRGSLQKQRGAQHPFWEAVREYSPRQRRLVWVNWEQLGCGMCAVELGLGGLSPALSDGSPTGSIVAITVTVIVVVVLVFGTAAYLKIR